MSLDAVLYDFKDLKEWTTPTGQQLGWEPFPQGSRCGGRMEIWPWSTKPTKSPWAAVRQKIRIWGNLKFRHICSLELEGPFLASLLHNSTVWEAQNVLWAALKFHVLVWTSTEYHSFESTFQAMRPSKIPGNLDIRYQSGLESHPRKFPGSAPNLLPAFYPERNCSASFHICHFKFYLQLRLSEP